MGDRFAQEAEAQLRACVLAAKQGVEVVPVWNKSNREHLIVGSEPASVYAAAAAVKKLDWKNSWHVGADHIRLETVDRFIPHSDFYTIDVADSIGKPVLPEMVRDFADRHPELIGNIEIPGIEKPMNVSREDLENIMAKYLTAIHEVRSIYCHIAQMRAERAFTTATHLKCWSRIGLSSAGVPGHRIPRHG
ncbi:MAG: hypothetical protein ABIR24_01085 [Verrucomicrobiota bacterium]